MKMKLNAPILGLILGLAPVIAVAQCGGEHRDQQAMSCIAGTQWDVATATCVPTVAS